MIFFNIKYTFLKKAFSSHRTVRGRLLGRRCEKADEPGFGRLDRPPGNLEGLGQKDLGGQQEKYGYEKEGDKLYIPDRAL